MNTVIKIQDQLNTFDSFLGVCTKSLLSFTIIDKEKIPIHKFEGYFLMWALCYKNSKTKEKQYKALEGKEEIDKRDKKIPLYVLCVKYN